MFISMNGNCYLKTESRISIQIQIYNFKWKIMTENKTSDFKIEVFLYIWIIKMKRWEESFQNEKWACGAKIFNL